MIVRRLALLMLLLAPTRTFAQSDVKAQAREHFDKGVAAFNDRRFPQAAAEFEAAYQLSPAFVVLYNIGQVNVMLGRPVEAVDALNRYLEEGGVSIAHERQLEVQRQIARQLSRIGAIFVRTRLPGAEVRVDARLVGKTPLSQPLRVVAGPHTVEARLPGGAPDVREVDVAGQGALMVELDPAAAVSPPIRPSPARPEPQGGARPPLPSQPAPAAAPSPAVHRRPVTVVSWPRVCGYALALAGLAAGAVGGVMAVRGANDANNARPRLAQPDGQERMVAKKQYDDGKALNRRGWVVAGIGAAALVGGVVLIVTAPEPTMGALDIAPWLAARSGGVEVVGRW